jgi:hypothetical protein
MRQKRYSERETAAAALRWERGQVRWRDSLLVGSYDRLICLEQSEAWYKLTLSRFVDREESLALLIPGWSDLLRDELYRLYSLSHAYQWRRDKPYTDHRSVQLEDSEKFCILYPDTEKFFKME